MRISDWSSDVCSSDLAMTKIPPGLLPEGLSDRLPTQAEASARLVRHVLDTVASHGDQRLMPTVAVFGRDLVARLPSAGSQVLRIIDPLSQRLLALRPHMRGIRRAT